MCLAAEAARLRNRPLAEWRRSRWGSTQFVTNIYDKAIHGNQSPFKSPRLITHRIKPILVLILAYIRGSFMCVR